MAQQTINIGSSANDGTGDTLRDGMDKANDNFTELYGRTDDLANTLNSPCISTISPAVQAAIKYMSINAGFNNRQFFFVSYIRNGNTTVTIQVSMTESLSASGDIVMQSERTSAAKTGWEVVLLTEVDGSGYQGIIIIDWDELAADTDYRADYWYEAGVYAVTIAPEAIGLGCGSRIDVLTDDANDIDGSKEMYTNDGAAKSIDLSLSAFEDLYGKIVINNVSDTYNMNAYIEAGTVMINGASGVGITVEPGDSAEMFAYSETVWYVKGTYTLIPPP